MSKYFATEGAAAENKKKRGEMTHIWLRKPASEADLVYPTIYTAFQLFFVGLATAIAGIPPLSLSHLLTLL
jgi:hypothetical protein